MATPLWQPGTLYAPGAIVQPASSIAPTAAPVVNGGFESGDASWTKDAGWTIGQFGDGTHFQGTWSAQWDAAGTGRIRATSAFDVQPGQTITASCQVQQGASAAGVAGGRVEIGWYTSGDVLISYSSGNLIDRGSNQKWKQSTVTGVAPPTAAKARIVGYAFRNSGGDELWMDGFTWDLQITALPAGLVFKATQALPGLSDSAEPVWPVILGGTVVDNEVTWEGVYASRVVWEATPILVSGATEPAFPALADATVADGTILWTAMNARVVQAPNSRIVVIASSKVFAGDRDIMRFCATVNCLDWVSPNDAGFIPFGLNTYGSTDISAAGLYRTNLVIFNSEGFQMWQVDQDPANIAFLDGVPMPCEYPDTVQPVSNDLCLLTSLGVRSVGIAGGSTNLQAGYFGEAVDELILAAIAAGETPFALTYVAAGQYWVIFGDEVFVLTMSGKTSDASWSRYVFPEAITDWCVVGTELHLRTEQDKVWTLSADALADDQLTVFEELEYDSPGSFVWQKPPKLTHVVIKARGAGGGGGGGSRQNSSTGGGGAAGGGYSETTILAAALADQETVTVGVGGTGGIGYAGGQGTTGNGTSGTAGTATSFGAHCVAGGGGPGLGASGLGTVPAGGSGTTETGGAGTAHSQSAPTAGGTTTTAGAGGGSGGNGNGAGAARDGGPGGANIDTGAGGLGGVFPSGDGGDGAGGGGGGSALGGTLADGGDGADGGQGCGGGGGGQTRFTGANDGNGGNGGSGGNGSITIEQHFDDDVIFVDGEAVVSEPFEGYMAWNYLDFGLIGEDKTLESVELSVDGEVAISIGWDQRRGQQSRATAPYTVDGDTVNGTPIPIGITAPSMQIRLTFSSDQAWKWFATTVKTV